MTNIAGLRMRQDDKQRMIAHDYQTMPDKRHHRGPHPADAELFSSAFHAALRTAVLELSWLLTRGYALPSSLKIVGDRHNLTERQRTAVMRCACSDEQRRSRLSRRIDPQRVQGKRLLIDGYNVLTSIEAALGGGVILAARDTCWRDMASMHGSYRKVDETAPALRLIGRVLKDFRIGPCVWYLDQPVSNSGRLAGIIRQVALSDACDWQAEIVMSPDAVLSGSKELIATADSVVLDRCDQWLNLARETIRVCVADARVLDLGEECGEVVS